MVKPCDKTTLLNEVWEHCNGFVTINGDCGDSIFRCGDGGLPSAACQTFPGEPLQEDIEAGARLDLAACAPQAFKMLLEFEHAGRRLTNQNQRGYDVICLCCKAEEPMHRNDCALVTLLRKAGLR